MKAYLAGPLCSKQERDQMEKLDELCKSLNIKTFLPHKDGGLWKEGTSFEQIAKRDLEAFKECDIVIANLNGFNVGAGTAYEMGYAKAKEIPIIAIKTDRRIKDSIEEVSAIIIGATKILESIEELKKELKKLV